MAFEACRLAVEFMTPVMLLSDGYIANGAEPWIFPKSADLPEIKVSYAKHVDGEEFLPYKRDAKLARPWAIPGTKGLEHRIGGIEKQHETGNISYDPENHIVYVSSTGNIGAYGLVPPPPGFSEMQYIAGNALTGARLTAGAGSAAGGGNAMSAIVGGGGSSAIVGGARMPGRAIVGGGGKGGPAIVGGSGIVGGGRAVGRPGGPDPRLGDDLESSKKEAEDHNLDHAVCRSWCPHCVKGRAEACGHRRRGGETGDAPTVSLDYMRTHSEPEKVEEKGTPIVVVKDDKTKMVMAKVAPSKGVREYAVELVRRFVEQQ
jgi:hypothetical protein